MGGITYCSMQALLDTNILLLHLTDKILIAAASDSELYISSITLAEALRFPGLSEYEVSIIRELTSALIVLSVDVRVAFRAGELGRTRTTRLPDLLIAATALEHRLVLITEDARDFKNIPDLDVRATL